MLWEITVVNYWEGSPDKEIFYPAVIDVMRFALTLGNDACIESGLHGLGHTADYAEPDSVKAIVDKFLLSHPDLRPELKKYAKGAALGLVQ